MIHPRDVLLGAKVAPFLPVCDHYCGVEVRMRKSLALQAELADVFIESALGQRKNTFILETHSEHLILRLMRRIREGQISSDDIGVVFVEPLARGSRFIELRIDEEGDFIDEWPGGFFEESFHEKFGGR